MKKLGNPFVRWALFALAIPLVTWLLAWYADRRARERGETTVTKVLRKPYEFRQRLAS
jgi:hypothetical protein